VWWRKNRSFHPDSGCYGVDINRNFDFLWPSGIGTSANPCDYQIYKGPSAFSEPETRNVRWLLDTNPNIMGMIDIHSYDNDMLFPWGDATDQETNPAENFQNPAYDGLRGVPDSSLYGEYIPRADLDWYTSVGNSVRDEELLTTPAGVHLAEALVRHGAELTRLLLADDALRDRAADLLAATEAAAASDAPLDPELVARAEALARDLAAQASPELRDTLAQVARDAARFKGRTIPGALRALGG
jgi:Zinc carboxypeptidase